MRLKLELEMDDETLAALHSVADMNGLSVKTYITNNLARAVERDLTRAAEILSKAMEERNDA